MEKQYIGARYVPLFAEPFEWNENQTYEPLTIVGYLNNSYTSKKKVPAGVDPTNSEYWVLTGNFNGQVSDLTNQVNEISSKTTVTGKKRIILVSDSYGYDRNGEISWTNQIAPMINNLQYRKVFAEGGSGFVGKANIPTFQDILTAGKPTVSDPDNITHIVVMGGANDAESSTQSLVGAAIKNFRDYVKENFPAAQLILGFCGWNNAGGATTSRYKQMETTYREIGEKVGFKYVNNAQYILRWNTFLTEDGVHPTTAGGEKIAQAAACVINGGEYTNVINQTTLTWEDAINWRHLRASILYSNNEITVIQPGVFQSKVSITPTSSTLNLCKLSNTNLLLGYTDSINCGTYLKAMNSNAQWEMFPCIFFFENSFAKLLFPQVIPTSIPGYTEFCAPTITMPTYYL